MHRREFVAGAAGAVGAAMVARLAAQEIPDDKAEPQEQQAAGAPKGEAERGYGFGPHPADVVPAAVAYLEKIGADFTERPEVLTGAEFLRFLWFPLAADEIEARNQVDALNLAANFAMCRGDEMQAMEYIGNGTFVVDLLAFAGGDGEAVAELVEAWEAFAGTEPGKDDHEPTYLTNSRRLPAAGQVSGRSGRGRVRVLSGLKAWATEYKAGKVAKKSSGDLQVELAAGKVLELDKDWDYSEQNVVAKFDGGFFGFVPKTAVAIIPEVVAAGGASRVPAPYLGPAADFVAAATGTGAPFVHGAEFIRRGLGQVDDGNYYAFRGVKKSGNEKVTDFDKILAEFSGLTLEKVRGLRGVQSAFLTRSKVTDGQRVVWLFQGGHTQPGVNQGLISVTADAAADRPDHEKPWATVDEFKPDAMEVFVELSSGVIVFLLFSGFDNDPDSESFGEFLGELQDFAPDFIARDAAAPGAADSRIDGAFDCLRCHCVHNDQRGPWIVLESDLGKLLRAGETDLTTITGQTDPAKLAALSRELRVRFWKPLTQANSDASEQLQFLSEAAGGPGNAGKLEEGETTARRQIGALVKIWNWWEHESVTAAEALARAGVVVGDDQDARAVFAELVPRIPGQVRYAAELRAGLGITTRAYRAVAVDLTYQITRNSGRLNQKPEG